MPDCKINMDIKILVVEDEVSINDILTTELKADGYSVRRYTLMLL